MTQRVILLFAATSVCLLGQAQFAGQIVRETPIGAVQSTVLYRAAVCPDGMVVVHTGGGEITMVESDGSVLRLSGTPIREATASVCDEQRRLFTAARGSIQVFDISQPSNLALTQNFYTSGIGLRLLVRGDVIYVLGFARLNGSPTLIRSYQWREGRFLGSITPDVPISDRVIPSRLLREGSLFILPGADRVVYVPVNPLEFHLFDGAGRLSNVVRPSVPYFHDAGFYQPLPRTDIDWVVNAVALPDGKIVAHVVRRGELAPHPVGAPYSHLNVFSSTFELLTGQIPAGEERFPGLLIGADAAGYLYFAKLSIPDGGKILKVRLTQ